MAGWVDQMESGREKTMVHVGGGDNLVLIQVQVIGSIQLILERKMPGAGAFYQPGPCQDPFVSLVSFFYASNAFRKSEAVRQEAFLGAWVAGRRFRY